MTRKEMFAALFEPMNGWADDETLQKEYEEFEKWIKVYHDDDGSVGWSWDMYVPKY